MVQKETQLVIPEVIEAHEFSKEHLEAMVLLIVRLGARLTLQTADPLTEAQLLELDGNFARYGMSVRRIWGASLEDGGYGKSPLGSRLVIFRREA